MDQLTGRLAQGHRETEARSGFARLAREPLVHFLLLGALLFALFDGLGGNRGLDSRRIVIDDAVVGDIFRQYAAAWQRPPTAAEMRGLLDNYVQEEVLYREGVALGLLDGDPVVRRRVRQKMDVLAEESLADAPPTDAMLQRWLDSHADRYAVPPLLSFEQVMFDPVKLGPGTGGTIKSARSRLAQGADPSSIGEQTLLPAALSQAPKDQIARDFGDEFALALARLPAGKWEGPLASGFGLHLVRINERVPGRKPALDEVRRDVARDFENDRRKRAAEAFYQDLLRDYRVIVKSDLPGAARPNTAANE
ncbi:MAG: peptidyl-prolyl cis-trans isomerase [Alphaproteobacteria bacterium]